MFLLRRQVLTTLLGWGISLVLIDVGGRWLSSLPTPELARPTATAERLQVPATPSAQDAPPGAALSPEPILARAQGASESARPLQRLRVTEPQGANLRAEPTTASAILATLPQGALVEATTGDAAAEAGGHGWQPVVWNGRRGWMLASLLQPVAAAP